MKDSRKDNPANGKDRPLCFEPQGRALIAIVRQASLTDHESAIVWKAVLGEAQVMVDQICVVALDLSAIETVNSVLLGLLVNLMAKLRVRGLGFCLVGVDPTMREMLRVTRLDRVFHVAESRDEIEKFCE